MIGSIATLARWLGPWADASRAPDVEIVDEDLAGMRVRRFLPDARPRATFLVAPGLHYAGADDPRMDRFCRILAAAGHLVVAPYIADYLALRPGLRAIADFRRAFDALPRWSDQKPIVFSISFGSLLAFALAAELGDEVASRDLRPGSSTAEGQCGLIDRLVVFGGYANLRETLRFCLTGEVASGRVTSRDPLNQPVVLSNLLHEIACADREAVAAAWRRFVEATWGRPEMKARERYCAVAEELAADVPEAVRELFLVGCGVRPGARELAEDALVRFDGRPLDPSPYLSRIRGRVELVHGTDDDVIPFEQAHALAAQLVNADVRVHITGMYGHTGAQAPRLAAAAKELATMLRVLRVLAG